LRLYRDPRLVRGETGNKDGGDVVGVGLGSVNVSPRPATEDPE
jgi:hypothetical protein